MNAHTIVSGAAQLAIFVLHAPVALATHPLPTPPYRIPLEIAIALESEPHKMADDWQVGVPTVIVAQRAFVTQIEREHGVLCRLVFPRLNGGRILSIRGAWNEAAKRAGLEGSLIHDLRRSAARRFTAAGVSRGTAMALAGWKTESVFERYNLVIADDLAAGLKKVAKHRASEASGSRVFRPIRPRSGPGRAKNAS